MRLPPDDQEPGLQVSAAHDLRANLASAGNAIILGGLTGAFVASRLRRPWAVSGWRRYAAAAAISAAPTTVLFSVYERRKLLVQHSREPLIFSTSEGSPFEFTRSSLSAVLRDAVAMPVNGPQQDPGDDGSTMKMFGSPGGSDRGAPPGISMPQLHVVMDGPHSAIKINDEEPVPQAQTNYDWYSPDKVYELEQHIAKTQERRQRIALEADFVWAWLSEKEAEHLEKFPVTKKVDKDSEEEKGPASRESSALVQTLGQVHAHLWKEANTCDWIIADSQKRIAQEKSRAANGRVEWRAVCSESASTSSLTETMEMLNTTLQMQGLERAAMEEQKSALAMSMADPEQDMNVRGFNPFQKTVTSQKELVKDYQKAMEERNNMLESTERALHKAIAEAKESSRKAS